MAGAAELLAQGTAVKLAQIATGDRPPPPDALGRLRAAIATQAFLCAEDQGALQ
jgi:hypothetical protein